MKTERTMLMLTLQLPEHIADIQKHYKLHHTMEAMLRLAQLMQHYYETETILGHPQQDQKCAILHQVYQSITLGLSILGIPWHRSSHVLTSTPSLMS